MGASLIIICLRRSRLRDGKRLFRIETVVACVKHKPTLRRKQFHHSIVISSGPREASEIRFETGKKRRRTPSLGCGAFMSSAGRTSRYYFLAPNAKPNPVVKIRSLFLLPGTGSLTY